MDKIKIVVDKDRKKSVTIEAVQSFKTGEPSDVVRCEKMCEKCRHPWEEHGWIETIKGYTFLVCPADWELAEEMAGVIHACHNNNNNNFNRLMSR